MNLFRKATARTISEVERRLEKAHPCARLEKDSVKLTPIFGTPFDATVFVFREKDPALIGVNRRILVGELARRDVPHVYQAYQLTENKIKKRVAVRRPDLFSLETHPQGSSLRSRK
jgi:hypothetical protein